LANSLWIVFTGDVKATRFLKPADVLNRSNTMLSKMLQDVQVETLMKANAGEEDFTLHIESDWENGSRTCLVVYRHKGSVVARVNPRQIDLALARHIFNKDTDDPDTDTPDAGCDDNSLP
jgi:hypothetical protein